MRLGKTYVGILTGRCIVLTKLSQPFTPTYCVGEGQARSDHRSYSPGDNRRIDYWPHLIGRNHMFVLLSHLDRHLGRFFQRVESLLTPTVFRTRTRPVV